MSAIVRVSSVTPYVVNLMNGALTVNLEEEGGRDRLTDGICTASAQAADIVTAVLEQFAMSMFDGE